MPIGPTGIISHRTNIRRMRPPTTIAMSSMHGSHEHDAAHDAGHEAQYDDRYRVAPPPAGDYDGDHYYAEDGHMPPQGDGAVPSRRRGGLLTIAAVLGLAVIGTAGAFGYRAYTSGPGGSANPPVIKADTTPAKIVPPARGALPMRRASRSRSASARPRPNASCRAKSSRCRCRSRRSRARTRRRPHSRRPVRRRWSRLRLRPRPVHSTSPSA